MWVRLVICLGVFCKVTNSDIFPSLLTTNASIAIVIDRNYVVEEYEPIKSKIEDYLVYAKREILKHGGVNTHLFAWSAINLKRDLTFLLSITSCTETWKLFESADTESLLHIAISEHLQNCSSNQDKDKAALRRLNYIHV
ncbi:hypothetical protein HUJ05_004314 [Dendroctonus ponderosae]|nr:hypothetical protein HUJ05_004314 [Dendroctonus ponderosae]